MDGSKELNEQAREGISQMDSKTRLQRTGVSQIDAADCGAGAKEYRKLVKILAVQRHTVGWCISTTKSGELRGSAAGELTEGRGHHCKLPFHLDGIVFLTRGINIA